MPIFEQGYQHWQGKLASRTWLWWTITRYGVRANFKSIWTKIILFLALVPALVLAAAFAIWGFVEQKADFIQPLLAFLRLPKELMTGPEAFRVPVWTFLYSQFFSVQTFFCMILVVVIGPGLVSKDLRFNAIPLYLSRPLRRFDYFLGKFGVIAVFVGAVTVVPALLAYLLGVLFSLDLGVVRDTAWFIPAILLYGLVMIVSTGTLMLALSSLSRNSLFVALFWIGVWWVSNAVAFTLTIIHTISLQIDLGQKEQALWQARRARDTQGPIHQVAQGLGAQTVVPAGTPLGGLAQHLAAFGLAKSDEFAELNPRVEELRMETKQARKTFVEAVDSNWRLICSYTGNLDRIGHELLDNATATRKLAEAFIGSRGNVQKGGGRRRVVQEDDDEAIVIVGNLYPWQWSAGVLLGLFGVSVWILTSRVKSLDRLR